MSSGEQTAEQISEQIKQYEQIAQQGRGLWVFITAVNMTVSLGLNIAHALLTRHIPDPGAKVVLTENGIVTLSLLSGLLPVLMAAFMSHALFAKVPMPVRVIVWMIFGIGMMMSLTAQFELFAPAVDMARAVGTVAVIDLPALTALGMIERGNRARRTAERLSAERRQAERQAADRERRERLAAERQAVTQAAEDKRQAERQAAAERLAAEQTRAAQAVAQAAEAERQAAEQAAEGERLRAERAVAERAAAERREAAERAEAERLAAERQAAAETVRVEQARAERMEAQRRAEAERREAERVAAERRAAAERAEAERKEQDRRARAARAAERQAAAEQAERGDLAAAEKKRIIRELYLADSSVNAPAAVAAVVAAGGTISDQRARAILSEIRQSDGDGLAEVRQLRKTAAV